jgi:hypothetical protein
MKQLVAWFATKSVEKPYFANWYSILIFISGYIKYNFRMFINIPIYSHVNMLT